MFSHWENKDSYGVGAGIAIENEYYWNTSFDMVDRYASIPEKMFDEGVTLVFAGGNDKEESAYTAKYKFDASPSVAAAGVSHDDQAYAVVKNYSEAVQDCLKDFGLADGTDKEKAIKESVDNVYKALANGKITPSRCEGGAGYEFCKSFSEKKLSNCFTLNGWFVDATTTAK